MVDFVLCVLYHAEKYKDAHGTFQSLLQGDLGSGGVLSTWTPPSPQHILRLLETWHRHSPTRLLQDSPVHLPVPPLPSLPNWKLEELQINQNKQKASCRKSCEAVTGACAFPQSETGRPLNAY